jgi:signal transduction histidine kinase
VGAADRVITALNDFARLPFPKIEPIELAQCLQEVLQINPLPPSIGVEQFLNPPDLAMLGDRAQLHIVFGNLIRNARDAMPEGGRLTITAEQQSNFVEVSIKDTGAGISPQDLPRILEPLYSTKAKGIGLGLAITNDIIKRHQGVLSVSSEPGIGSTFTVRLNAAS